MLYRDTAPALVLLYAPFVAYHSIDFSRSSIDDEDIIFDVLTELPNFSNESVIIMRFEEIFAYNSSSVQFPRLSNVEVRDEGTYSWDVSTPQY